MSYVLLFARASCMLLFESEIVRSLLRTIKSEEVPPVLLCDGTPGRGTLVHRTRPWNTLNRRGEQDIEILSMFTWVHVSFWVDASIQPSAAPRSLL